MDGLTGIRPNALFIAQPLDTFGHTFRIRKEIESKRPRKRTANLGTGENAMKKRLSRI